MPPPTDKVTRIILQVTTAGLMVRQWDSGAIGLYCRPSEEMDERKMILTLAHRIAVLESALARIDKSDPALKP